MVGVYYMYICVLNIELSLLLHVDPCSLLFYTTIAFISYIPCINFLRDNVQRVSLNRERG